MTGTVAHIFRHPIKSHGFETLDAVDLTEGQTMPWDRRWAVAHEMARTDGTEWAACANFSRGAKAPGLMSISAASDEAAGKVTLTAPGRAPLTFDPDGDPAAFLDWVKPLMPEDRAQSARIVRVEGRGMTDTPFPSISINNLSSNRAVGQKLGMALAPRRWRGNLWLDGLGPWEEFEWVGKTLRIGTAELAIEERIQRCLATSANPETGRRDADTLGALEQGWGHRDFGVYGRVVTTGTVKVGDPVQVL